MSELSEILEHLWDKRGNHSKLPMHPKTESIKEAEQAIEVLLKESYDRGYDKGKFVQEVLDDKRFEAAIGEDVIVLGSDGHIDLEATKHTNLEKAEARKRWNDQ